MTYTNDANFSIALLLTSPTQKFNHSNNTIPNNKVIFALNQNNASFNHQYQINLYTGNFKLAEALG